MPQSHTLSASASTTLHLTLLISHYVGAAEVDDTAATTVTSAGGKKEAANSKAPVVAAKAAAAGKEKEATYVCPTAPDQLDSVARVLRTVLQRRYLTASPEHNANHDAEHIALGAQRVQLAKAVRDGAIPWPDIAAAVAEAEMDGANLSGNLPVYGDGRLKMSTSSLLSDAACFAATVASSGAAAKPSSRTSSRGRGSASGPGRQRAPSVSSRRVSAVPAVLQSLSETESRHFHVFVESQLPACEAVVAAAPRVSAGVTEGSAAAPWPVFFVYRLLHEDDVVAALSALTTATVEPAGADAGNTAAAAAAERERRRVRASQASAIVTRAVWATLRPVLRAYLHSTAATAVPSHLSVVWAVADPRLLEGLNSHTGKDGDEGPVFFPCAATASSSSSSSAPGAESVEVNAAAERWVRLVLRGAAYLYDPAALTGTSSPAVDAALDALRVERLSGGQRGAGEADPPKTGHRRTSGDTGLKGSQSSRGNPASSSSAAAPKNGRASGAGPNNNSGAPKGRNGNGRGDAVAASSAAAQTYGEAFTNALLEAAETAVQVDFNADPAAFPYCTTDATSLACYLYASCDAVTDAPTSNAAAPASLTRDQRGKATTLFLRKAAAYQRAVLAASTANAVASLKPTSALRVTADLLRWFQLLFSSGAPATTHGKSSGDNAAASYLASLDSVAKASLTKSGLDASHWPIPLWTIATVPLAAIPPLPLRSIVASLGRALKEGCVAPPENDTLGALAAWAATVEKVDAPPAASGGEAGLLSRLARIGSLVDAYGAWTQHDTSAHPDRSATRAQPKKSSGGRGSAGRAYFTPDAYTGGVFTAVNGAAALMAEADRSLVRQSPPRTLTAVCASTAAGEEGAEEEKAAERPAEAVSAPSPRGLFQRYAMAFQRLAVAQDNGAGATEAAVVPRCLSTGGTTTTIARCTVTTTTNSSDSADVVLPPYPQEVVAMVRHLVAKNAGHFEVNAARGTDTITAASAGGSPLAMLESTITGFLSPVARQTALNTTTQSTGLLLRQQQQQQRRRQRGQGGSTAANLRPYVHGVRFVREVAKSALGRRPNTEAAVLLQEALETTLTAPREEGDVCDDAQHKSGASGGGGGGGSAANTRQHTLGSGGQRRKEAIVNALELLQRYLGSSSAPSLANAAAPSASGGPSPLPIACHVSAPAATVRKGAGAYEDDYALSAANAASAAAQALTPRVYEHCLQQVLLRQLMREAGLEQQPQRAPGERGEVQDRYAGDWSVTEQVPTETIVPALVDFRERFGAHNVVVKASTLDYQVHPAAAFNDTTAKTAVEALEVHRTSAYAHNALNVHPTRRATQLWMVGVALPQGTSLGELKQGTVAEQPRPSFARARSRKWVDMVPRAGIATSVEVYAVWTSLLSLSQEEAGGGSSIGSVAAAEKKVCAAEGGRGTPALTSRLVYQLLRQYVQRRAESSTAMAKSGGGTLPPPPSSPPAVVSEAATVSASPMRFSTHETLYPFDEALLEVWSGEAQRTCRYMRASEVTAALHAGVRTSAMLSTPLHLSVRWDDGLLFSCSTDGSRQSVAVPVIDVEVTTSNFVVQRRAREARLLLRRYPNTSSCATASGIAAAHESSGSAVASPPQGLLSEVCAALFEKRTTLLCVHDCPAWENGSSTAATLDTTLEESEVSCEVDEKTGVVRRSYPSGMQLLQFPSGATLTRRPTHAAAPAKADAATPRTVVEQWCETLVTFDGRCFVRCVGSSAVNAASATTATASFRRVVPLMKRSRQPPAFTVAESAYDAVRHCHVRSRQDGLTVVEYTSMVEGRGVTWQPGATLARVVAFPDGTAITTLAPRYMRHRTLSANGASSHSAAGAGSRGGAAAAADEAAFSAAVALSSPSLCAMLEEVEAVESGLFGPCAGADADALEPVSRRSTVTSSAQPSVRWLVEAPALPRLYLAPSDAGDEEAAAFAVIFGDGTVLQRHWMPTAAVAAPATLQPHVSSSHSSGIDGLLGSDSGSNGNISATAAGADAAATAAYKGGTVATLLVRPSTSAVRVLHQHAIATVEPVDVLVTTTRASAAAYAVGQGLPFFDLAHGGGMRLIDAARCVWEVRGLATPAGPKVLYPDRTCTYEELLRELVSTHYSPHRLPRAAELTYASEQRREALAYAQQRSTGWCPPLQRRLRELSEPYIRTANLLRSDVLAPMEAEAAALSNAVQRAVMGAAASHPPNSAAASAHRGGGSATHAIASIRPVCFGQLANGESIRYWCAKDVLRPSAEGVSAAVSEANVLQRVVPSISTGGVLRYTSSGPSYASAAEVMAFLSAGGRGGTGNDYSALRQRLAAAQRLMLLCVGGLAPAIPRALQGTQSSATSFTTSYVPTLPPLAAQTAHGCRWLPPALQPPQQFSSAHSKSVQHAVAAQSDVVWAQDAATATAGSAYVQYATDRSDSGTSATALLAAVARRELHRYEELAHLSHYHRVLTAQWPMEQPNAAREEQVRLETRYAEQQRARRPLFTDDRARMSPLTPRDANATGRRSPASRLTV